MKTYLLKNPATVERKSEHTEHKPCSSAPPSPRPPTSLTDVSSRDSQPRCSPARSDAPATVAAPAGTILGSTAAVAHGPVLFIGMQRMVGGMAGKVARDIMLFSIHLVFGRSALLF